MNRNLFKKSYSFSDHTFKNKKSLVFFHTDRLSIAPFPSASCMKATFPTRQEKRNGMTQVWSEIQQFVYMMPTAAHLKRGILLFAVIMLMMKRTSQQKTNKKNAQEQDHIFDRLNHRPNGWCNLLSHNAIQLTNEHNERANPNEPTFIH